MTEVQTFRLTIPGAMLRRGFWLYVWRAVTADNNELLYVGRTGDNSSPNASPPYIRMGQHLGSIKNQNALRIHLVKNGVTPEECRKFDLVAHGPIYAEVVKPSNYDRADNKGRLALMKLHNPVRNVVGAMEKRLAIELSDAGYIVMNTVRSSHDVDQAEWLPIRRAFAEDFPDLQAIA
jgi:hypothetical protein